LLDGEQYPALLMTTLGSCRATPVLLALFSATLACGGGAPVAPASAATITLTDTGCVANGLGALVPEHFTATLVNKNPFEARFKLHRMAVGHA
jgi:hypothetical protein